MRSLAMSSTRHRMTRQRPRKYSSNLNDINNSFWFHNKCLPAASPLCRRYKFSVTPGPSCRGWVYPYLMNIDIEIQRSQDQMATLWKITINLQADGIPDSDPVFDQIVEKSWSYILKLECTFYLMPENRFTLGPEHISYEFSIPRSVLDNFTPSKLGGMNPNNHYHLQN